jgi:hypothetical protein
VRHTAKVFLEAFAATITGFAVDWSRAQRTTALSFHGYDAMPTSCA